MSRISPLYSACRAVMMIGMLALAGCATRPPSSQENICAIFREKPDWYQDSLRAARRWKGPLDVPMAIMAQESSFRAKAKPPIRFFLGFIPYGRASNAYGYPQALDSTWAAYRKDAGGLLRQRDDFGDAIDFIQWYMHQTWKINRIDKSDAYGHYLNYHEGQGGYRRGSYQSKAWLTNVAKRVKRRAENYRDQLATCRPELEKRAKRRSLF